MTSQTVSVRVEGVRLCAALVGFLVLWLPPVWAETLMSRDAFLNETFNGAPPPVSLLWLSRDQKAAAADILGHPFAAMRLRYWMDGSKTAWIIDEIGKEQPITIGVVIDGDSLQAVRILDYRESRGWEVRESFFTRQFPGLTLGNDQQLSGRVDGITGATLSVRAVTNVSRLSLQLARDVRGAP
jgi:hypothetical protein